MTDFIYSDGIHFCQAVGCGALLCFIYDWIRIFRRICVHKKVIWISVEDILFWIVAGLVLFVLSFETRNGVVRGFLLIGAVFGAAVYQVILGKHLVVIISKFLRILIKYLSLPLKKAKFCCTMISGKIGSARKLRKEDESGNRQKKAGKQVHGGSKSQKTKTL